MFQPDLFREDRPKILHDLMMAHPFTTLVSAAAGPLCADHIPLVLHVDASGGCVLRGHVAVANPLATDVDRDIDVLAIFQGPQAYVTPSWYPTKQEHGKVVPTWNYVVVHAHGSLSFHRDRDWLLAHLTELTARQEGKRTEPWAVSDAPDDFVGRQIRGITGIEIGVHSLDGTWKVSQNKTPKDRAGVVLGLENEGAIVMSELVDDVAK